VEGSGGADGLHSRLLAWDEALTAPLRVVALPGSPRAPGSRAVQVLALCLAHSGDIYAWCALCVAAWFLGDDAWKLRGLLVATGLVAAQALVSLVKYVVRRQRPPGTAGRTYRKIDPYSFPSGHGARASMLIILSCAMGPVPLALAVCLWSPAMLWSRVAIGVHYVLDICGGLLLGAGVGGLLVWLTPVAAEWAQRLASVMR